MKTNPTRKSAVKAWAILNENENLMLSATYTICDSKERADAMVVMREGKYIVPCTITFNKPKKV